MERIIINTPGFISQILVGEKWEAVSGLLPEKNAVIITDNNVKRLYGKRFPELPVFPLTPGEGSKNLKVIENLAERLLEAGIDRSGFVLGIGGGVVCDVAGFLASIYMRGISFGFISSTLLSQVDASTGGKNGVNLGGTKNMLGTFRQPEFVICDPAMLHTLPEQEYLSGLAEMIKTAVIGDKELFELIERSFDEIISRDNELMTLLVSKCVRFKGNVVSKDEKESGLRRILNFGHTYGHAIEMRKKINHGFAVASGMELATEFSYERGYINLEEKERINNLLMRFKLIGDIDLPDDQMEKLVEHDKKKTGTGIYFVFAQGIGQAKIENMPVGEVLEFYKRFRGYK
ncbi:MAG: 3-dehydroquinate synthase [Bacteroidales bacterium]